MTAGEAPENTSTGRRLKAILTLGLPIIGGMASQNILNLVDTAMVGQLGSPALAAVGIGSIANWLAFAFFQALGSGVQAISARRLGEKDPRGAVVALHGALFIALAVVIPLSLLAATQADAIFALLSSDPEVVSLGTDYIGVRLCAAGFVTANFAFRGYWNGIGLSMVYLRTIVVIHVLNIILNWLLIYGNLGFPRLGVEGAALASAISVAIGTGTYVFLAWRRSRSAGFLSRTAALKVSHVRNVLRLSIPAGVQNLFFAGGFLAFFRIAELLGTRELAVTNVLINLALVCVLPGIGLGLAAATLVGKSLGEGNAREAARWGWTTVLLATTVIGVVGVVLAIAPRPWLGLFMNDPAAEAIAVVPLILLGLSQPIDTIGVVLSNAMIGAGYVRAVMVVSVVLQWGFFLPMCLIWSVNGGGGLLSLWILMGIWRAMSACSMAILFRRGKWAEVEV